MPFPFLSYPLGTILGSLCSSKSLLEHPWWATKLQTFDITPNSYRMLPHRDSLDWGKPASRRRTSSYIPKSVTELSILPTRVNRSPSQRVIVEKQSDPSCSSTWQSSSMLSDDYGWISLLSRIECCRLIPVCIHLSSPTTRSSLWNCRISKPVTVFFNATVWAWKGLAKDAFRRDLISTDLCASNDDWAPQSADDMATSYQNILCESLDKHAPKRSMQKRHRPLTPWFNEACVKQKRRSRCLERVYHRNPGLFRTVVGVNFVHQKRSYHAQNKDLYWQTTVSESSGNARKLWNKLSVLDGEEEFFTSAGWAQRHMLPGWFQGQSRQCTFIYGWVRLIWIHRIRWPETETVRDNRQRFCIQTCYDGT